MNNPDLRSAQSTGATQSGPSVVRYTVSHFLDERAPVGLTVAVTWSCNVCHALVRCPGVAGMVTTIEDHAYAHHHRGAVKVLP
jgi:hypothetical protein